MTSAISSPFAGTGARLPQVSSETSWSLRLGCVLYYYFPCDCLLVGTFGPCESWPRLWSHLKIGAHGLLNVIIWESASYFKPRWGARLCQTSASSASYARALEYCVTKQCYTWPQLEADVCTAISTARAPAAGFPCTGMLLRHRLNMLLTLLPCWAADLRGKELVMRLMMHPDQEVQKQALLCVQKIMLARDKLEFMNSG